ncbi:MAG TPA: response regulator transcription factor [Pseudolabrys sp.]|nr:response regulator transcription factor [Pseudolabrys sp.]
MNIATKRLAVSQPLRILIDAPDSLRRSALSRLVVETGHIVVDDLKSADVVLLEGSDVSVADGLPVLALGTTDTRVRGMLSRDASTEQIDAALRAVAAGLIVRSSAAENAGFDSTRESEARALLTPRELDVLAAIADGDTNKAIARRLGISLHTVKFHVESLFRKLGARTRTEALAKASERRLSDTITL